MKKVFLFAALMLMRILSNGQVAVSYFPFQSLIAVSSNTEKLLWGDFKAEVNSFVSNLNMELSPKINFKMLDRVNYYVGPGINFNIVTSFADLPLVNGYLLDFGARIKPLQSHKNVQIVFEVSPYVNREFSGGSLRARLGLSYNFSPQTKTPVAQ